MHDVRARLSELRPARSTARGLVLFFTALAGYVLSFLAAGAVPGWPAKLLCAFPIFYYLARLALVGHDAGHGSLTASAALNRWLGRLAFLPSWHPYTTWVVSHNTLHHAYTNLRGKDPMWAPLSKVEFDRLSPLRRALERCYRTPLGVALYYLIEYWWKALLFPRGAMRERVVNSRPALFDCLAVSVTFLVQCLALVAWQRFVARRLSLPESPVPVLLVAGVLLPFFLMSWWSGLVGFLHHTHPRVHWYANVAEWCRFRGRVEGTVHNVIPWPLGWLTGNSLEHTAHHVDPKVPFTALPASQRRLEETCPEVVVQRLTLRECLRILSACKLYDYQRHRWLGYDGEVTAEVAPR
jgi:omega-6 fatty acid desaturase (delta-12 desaturase)